ncbi:short chain oxidoreductase [Penicillium desertorum]|uniref:Short chain oxidoreductase n=1 Tax=Penicillium desertorum TaxID=1303715 RepID=A0A9X0BVK2_9EURO|nr:short chain oxidoreductase [Penicillium desertorum]
MEEVFRLNVSGVHNLTKAILPLMRKGEEKKILNISTTLGSISLQHSKRIVTVPSYKITKAALSMLTVVYASELENEGFTWLKTDLGTENADLPVDVGVSSVLDILYETGQDGNGRFFNIHVPGWENVTGLNQYDGKEIPW